MMSLDLDKRNFENLIHFYAAKLKLVQKGNDPYKVLTASERYNLQVAGILVYKTGIKTLELSKEAIDILNKIHKGKLEF